MLAEEGVDGNKTTSGGTVFERNWNDQGITYILKNEKYSGDLLLQKYYTVDFLTKKVAPNNGQLPQYFVENSHEPVIPREIFQQVQAEMARRRKHWQEFKYYHSNVLSSKVVCGNCGLPYRQVKTTWRCDSKMNKSRHPDVECRNDSIRDDRLRQIIVDAFNALPERRDELVRLEERLRWGGLDKADEVLTRMETAMDSLEEEIREAQEAGNTDAEENARKQLAEVREKWAAASEQRAVYADKALHIRSLQDRVRAIAEGSEERPYRESPNGRCAKPDLFFRLTRPGYADGRVTECSDDDILRFIEKVEIGWQTVTVTFKAGISVELPREA